MAVRPKAPKNSSNGARLATIGCSHQLCAYALDELTVEISAAILCAELGIADQVSDAQREKHLANHAGYLQSWIKALSKDSFAIFTAAKAADKVSEYVLELERQATAMQGHAEWMAEYESAASR